MLYIIYSIHHSSTKAAHDNLGPQQDPPSRLGPPSPSGWGPPLTRQHKRDKMLEYHSNAVLFEPDSSQRVNQGSNHV